MIKEICAHDCDNSLNAHIDKFPDTKVLVVGDIIMDQYIWGDVTRISPEAPVPVVVVKQETKMLGGAANVINNVHSLGGKSILCGVIGKDRIGREILDRVKGLVLTTDGIITEPDRPTSIKTRVIAHSQQVVRFDRESVKAIRAKTTRKILRFVEENLNNIHVVIVADYGKGLISGEIMEGLQERVRGTGKILAVDPKVCNFQYYKGIDVITPNHHEAGAFCGIEIRDEDSLIRAGREMIEKLNCRSVLITQGKDGMTLFENTQEITHIPTVARQVFDVTGAGDTVISTLCLGLASGMNLKSAAVISNFAAGIVVGQVGTSAVGADELKRVVNDRLRESEG
jgi:D-beta-D-heptose 7-phosphate kinase/D-beta-D-heptose 1-phosphate adenosyltransferase